MASRKRGRPFGSQLSLSTQKERERMMDRERGKERIFIGYDVERWNRLKEDLNLMYNHEVAGFLLNSYEHNKGRKVISSTPMHGLKPITELLKHPAGISDISSAESGKTSDLAMSGIEQIEARPSGSEDPKPPNRKKAKGSEYSASFLDPLEISIDISEEVEDLEESDDESYQPSINISIG
ncbi:uncharacterized protein LOC125682453 [Ostrea edulis]|uniref:uncharacterized protein LOC125682453 n=1 Tax=Ostrea edulis TaxID=37623 RepID=UPI0024AFADCE|nr:uncharacterized protein LOC125682453 [Ostrea edulis]